MQDFEHYVKSNYNIPNTSACSITYSYNYKLAEDKKSNKMIINNIIKMTLIFMDVNGKQLATEKLTFVNDTLTKASEKQCKTISPGEVTNRFRVAKTDIARQLIKVKQDKINDLQHDINLLTSYNGSGGIIPQQMKSTLQLADSRRPHLGCTNSPQTARLKTTFDM